MNYIKSLFLFIICKITHVMFSAEYVFKSYVSIAAGD